MQCWYGKNTIILYSNSWLIMWQLYDHTLTMGREIEYVWPTSWSLGKCLYFASKYLAIIDGAMQCYSNYISTNHSLLFAPLNCLFLWSQTVHVAPPTALPSTCALLYKISGGRLFCCINTNIRPCAETLLLLGLIVLGVGVAECA